MFKLEVSICNRKKLITSNFAKYPHCFLLRIADRRQSHEFHSKLIQIGTFGMEFSCWILRNKIFWVGVTRYMKLNFRSSWVSTDPLLMEDREHLPGNVDKSIFASWRQTWSYFHFSPPRHCTEFLRAFIFLQMIFFLVTIRRYLLSIRSLPFDSFLHSPLI